MKKIRHYAHALIAIAVFTVSLSLYGTWYSYVGKESARAAGLAQDITAKEQAARQTSAAKDELERALADEAAIRDYFVDTNDIVPFLESLQSTGASLGSTVSVESVSAQADIPHEVLMLALRITGPFSSVVRTLGAIEYGAYDTALTSLTLDTPGPSAGGAPQWTAAVMIRIGTLNTATVASSSPAQP